MRMLLQCALGMTHCHTSDLIHRDLRADNVFVAAKDPLRLCIGDLGLAVVRCVPVLAVVLYTQPAQPDHLAAINIHDFMDARFHIWL